MPSMGFNRAILREVAHRPWPMPERPWIMTQTWHDLLFAHWPVDARALAALVPAAFALDRFDGQAWLGIVPFRMTNVSARYVPAVPWMSAFPELNVRTYVTVNGKPGVYFFSLDAGSRLAVLAARALFNLPYFGAAMRVEPRGAAVVYSSRRAGAERAGRRADLRLEYEPLGPVFEPVPGSIEHFLTERYCLYALDRRARPYRLEIHHPPWPLQAARAVFEHNTMAAAAGLPPLAGGPRLHFARRQDMVGWGPERLA